MIDKLPVIRALMKIRNEEKIIKNTLDHWAPYCTGGFYIVDDVSDDRTVEICKAHPAVKDIQIVSMWDPDRERAEWYLRQLALMHAQQNAGPDDWFVYLDADEYLFNFNRYELFYDPHIKAIACRLYDFYITPSDLDLPYLQRQWIGPEFRTIVFFFRNSPYIKYEYPDQRIVNLEPGIQIPLEGDIKHFSKAISVESWEKMCDYYTKFWPRYSDKWRQRKGKAVKEDYCSDFGNKLIRWVDRHKGFSLESQPYGLK